VSVVREETGVEWGLVDVTSVWVRKNLSGAAISIRSDLLRKLLGDLTDREDVKIKAAIYLSRNRPGAILVKLLVIPSEV